MRLYDAENSAQDDIVKEVGTSSYKNFQNEGKKKIGSVEIKI